VTLPPIRRFGFRRRILFSDILGIPSGPGSKREFMFDARARDSRRRCSTAYAPGLPAAPARARSDLPDGASGVAELPANVTNAGICRTAHGLVRLICRRPGFRQQDEARRPPIAIRSRSGGLITADHRPRALSCRPDRGRFSGRYSTAGAGSCAFRVSSAGELRRVPRQSLQL